MVAISASLGLIASTLSPSAATAAYSCAPTKSLSKYSSRTTTQIGSGVVLGEVNFDPGVANPTVLNTKVSWAKGSLAKVKFVSAQAPVGETSSQYKLAADFSALA